MTANKDLRAAAEATEETIEKVEELAAAKEFAKTEGGKLIVSEEVAIGHVSWNSSECFFYSTSSASHTYILRYSEALLRGLDWDSYNTPSPHVRLLPVWRPYRLRGSKILPRRKVERVV
jgi:hypothetical protein